LGTTIISFMGTLVVLVFALLLEKIMRRLYVGNNQWVKSASGPMASLAITFTRLAHLYMARGSMPTNGTTMPMD
jgi:hypothetical protein